jgi:hypothetical protein
LDERLRLGLVLTGLLVRPDLVGRERLGGFLLEPRVGLRWGPRASLSPSEDEFPSLESLLSEALLSVHALLTLPRDSALLASLELASLSWSLASPPLPSSLILSAPFFSAARHMERVNFASKSANCTTIVSGALNVRQFCHTRSTSFLNNFHL